MESITRKIDSLDLTLVDAAALRSMIAPLVKGYAVILSYEPAGLEVFRARPLNQPPSLQCELSYPPPEITPLGRLNHRGSPVFYAAYKTMGATQEIGLKEGDTYCISRWKINAICRIALFGYAEKYSSGRGSSMEHPYIHMLKNESQESRSIRQWIAEKFNADYSEECYRYKLTAALADAILNDTGRAADAIQYPSVAWELGGDCLAFKPAFVDQHMSLQEARMVRLHKITRSDYYTEELDSSTNVSRDGKITWCGRLNPRFISQKFPLNLFQSTRYGGSEVFSGTSDTRIETAPRFRGYSLPEPRYDRCTG